MLNRLKFNTLSLSFLFLMFVLAWGTTTAFAAETTIYNPSFVMTANGDHVEFDIIDSGATIDVKCDETRGHQEVSFKSDHISCCFWVAVLNNRIIEAYRPYCCSKIETTGCTYSNEFFYWNTQWAELSFDVRCWDKTFTFYLRATVMGSNNKIETTSGIR